MLVDWWPSIFASLIFFFWLLCVCFLLKIEGKKVPVRDYFETLENGLALLGHFAISFLCLVIFYYSTVTMLDLFISLHQGKNNMYTYI